MSSWPSQRLEEIADIERAVIDPESVVSGVPYVGLEHIVSGGNFSGVEPVKNGDLKSSKFSFSAEHILYGKLRPYLAKIAAPDFAGICSTEIVPVRPGPKMDRGFLLHFLRQPGQIALATSRSTGANLPRLSPKELSKFLVPVPPLTEQRRIAAILDQADALRAKRRTAEERLDCLEQATFEQSFLHGANWPNKAVGNVARSLRTGPFGSQLLHSEFVDEGIAVLGIDNAVTNAFAWGERRFITEAKYRNLSRYRVYPRDVIVTIMGTCGRAAIVPDDIPLAITTKHLCSITLDEAICLPEYLHACLLRHPAVLRQLGVTARGAVMPGLNMGLIKETMIPLPPIEVQKTFANRQHELLVSHGQMDRSSKLLNDLFASLQQRAFQGDL